MIYLNRENDIMNAIRMNYYKKEDFRHALLKGVKTYDALEHACKEASVKEILKKVEANNKRIFIGLE